MDKSAQPFRSVMIFTHPALPDSAREGGEILRVLRGRGISADCAPLNDESARLRLQSSEFDLLIALGGDGTMLRASHLSAPAGVPMLGINMGHFGFLTEISREDWRSRLDQLLEGDYRLEHRMMLRVEHWTNEECLGVWRVLNDVVVCRGSVVRPLRLKAWVDGFLLTRYVADGLIAATPTGSTAYALAAGGPILPPEMRNIVIVPVAPHLSMDSAIVLAEGAHVSIGVQANSHDAVMSGDGQAPQPLAEGDTVRVSMDEFSACFIRFEDAGYFYRNITKYMEQNPTAGD